jgi:protein-S-isoprenylcysteine O-methyltransferase Ste14
LREGNRFDLRQESDMNTRPPIAIPPPILVVVLMVIAGLLAVFFPLPAIAIPFHGFVGTLLVAIGIGIGAAGFATFKQFGTPVRPGAEPAQLVMTGPFQFTRNPMYLGLLIVLIAAFFVSQSPYFLVPPVLFFLVIDFRMIPFEERLLADRFGEEYEAYRKRVRRWI